MTKKSNYLDGIITKHNRAASMKIVFVDVQAYSKRRTQIQADVVEAFTRCLQQALKQLSQQYIEYAQNNNLNFQTDLISIPSGDGAAVAIPFDALHCVHLDLARLILEVVYNHNRAQGCVKFEEQGWCNCHSAFNLSVGISEGRGLIYEDVNGNYNVAGTVINMAARVLNLAGPKQIVFTEDAYKQIIDMVDDPHLDERFKMFENVRIKHDLCINIYQYVDSELEYLDSQPPEDVEFMTKTRSIMKTMGMPAPFDQDVQIDKKKALAFLEALGGAVSPAGGKRTELPPINALANREDGAGKKE